MKGKLKIIVSVLLIVAVLVVGLVVNDRIETKSEAKIESKDEVKWVLTQENRFDWDENNNPILSCECFYEYDASGKLIGETREYSPISVWRATDFKYDENGNVIYKSGILSDYYEGESEYSYQYTYDSAGNCTRIMTSCEGSSIIYGTTVVSIDDTTYVYDEHGNVIEEHVNYNSSYGTEKRTEKITKTMKLTYENDLCVQSEITSKSVDNNSEATTSYYLERFTYDEYGHKIKEDYYTEADSEDDPEDFITVNDKNYTPFQYTEYIYEKLEDIAVSKNTDSQSSNTENDAFNKTVAQSQNLSEYGFYDTSIWGNTMYEITPDDNGNVFCSDSKGTFVIVEKGNSAWEFYPEQQQVLAGHIYGDFEIINKSVIDYTVPNNDRISVYNAHEGSGTLQIFDRLIKDDCLAFEIVNNGVSYQYYLPSIFIDDSREPEPYQEKAYKIYLK